MNKTFAGIAAAGMLVFTLSACSIPGAAATTPEKPPTQSQPAPTQAQPIPTQQQQPIPQPPIPHQTTVAIGGEQFTCGEIVDDTDGCGQRIQEAFELYGGSLDGYVNSGRIGVLNSDDYSFQDAAYAGLTACTVGFTQSAAFTAHLHTDNAFSNLKGSDLLPAFFEAHRYLCP